MDHGKKDDIKRNINAFEVQLHTLEINTVPNKKNDKIEWTSWLRFD